jgi:hypothetical protein
MTQYKVIIFPKIINYCYNNHGLVILNLFQDLQ